MSKVAQKATARTSLVMKALPARTRAQMSLGRSPGFDFRAVPDRIDTRVPDRASKAAVTAKRLRLQLKLH
ncbi:hypothetical protein NWI01_20980 [Nitrobacter winogradskyi]|uniref:Uncharacterized protein n=1 Tax=Nitrobacter winogradskyi TaxID=913 RepID=A0A4Y3WG15_NITWI|nr:hypothetical protein NWI01_20980 [Nitrobacter winogradskyi]